MAALRGAETKQVFAAQLRHVKRSQDQKLKQLAHFIPITVHPYNERIPPLRASSAVDSLSGGVTMMLVVNLSHAAAPAIWAKLLPGLP